MFGFSYTEGGPWSDDGIKAITKFLERVEKIALKLKNLPKSTKSATETEEKELLYATNYAIKCVDKDMESFSFNTAVARLMELLNALTKYDALQNKNNVIFAECFKKFIQLLAPCAPHFSEEIWEWLKEKGSIFNTRYPVCDEKALIKDEVEVAVQINSKMRNRLVVPCNADEETIKQLIFADKKLSSELSDKQIKKLIIVPNRLINIIV